MPHYGWNQFLRISQRAAATRPERPSSGAITFEGRSVEELEEAIWSQGTYAQRKRVSPWKTLYR